MCTKIIIGSADLRMPTWDRPNVAIIVSDALDQTTAHRQVRALLSALGAPQDQSSPTCWCGDEVELPQVAVRMPRQLGPRHHEEVRRGA